MNESEIQNPSLIYTSTEPDLNVLKEGYDLALVDNNPFYQNCAVSYDDRHNLWAGKTWDMRKSGPNAFPWQGASDNEVNVVGERLDSYVSLLTQSLTRSFIQALPTSAASAAYAATVSSFIKWMQSTYIRNFKAQAELAANHLVEKAIMVTYTGWRKESRSRLQLITLDQIAEASEDGEAMVEMIMGGENDEDIANSFSQAMNVTMGRAKKAIRQLRDKGEAEIPISVESINEPVMETLSPDGDIIFPSWTMDPQEAPFFFIRKLMTAQMLEKMVTSEGWDADWVDYAIEKLRGLDSDKIEGEKGNLAVRNIVNDDKNLVLVLYAYQRLIDPVDGSEGIYCTVFSPRYTGGYAKHELLNGLEEYPIVVSRLNHSEKRLYESNAMSRTLRGPQNQVKVEVDSRIDRASLATNPPMMHPAGKPPSDWGPGRKVPYRRLGEITFGPAPGYDPGSKEIEMTMRAQADKAVGLDMENPLAVIRQQHIIDIYLSHFAKVLDKQWKLFQMFGPDEIFFQVSGDPSGQVMQKGMAEDNYSIVVSFDATNNDPETVKNKITAMGTVLQFDTENVIDRRKYIEMLVRSIDPIMGAYIMQPQDASLSEMTKDVTDDLAKIYAGIPVPARPNGAQIALEIIQNYMQLPSSQQKAQQDESFVQNIEQYAGQYTFQMQQAQNAAIGRIGTAPAQMGAIDTQNMQQG